MTTKAWNLALCGRNSNWSALSTISSCGHCTSVMLSRRLISPGDPARVSYFLQHFSFLILCMYHVGTWGHHNRVFLYGIFSRHCGCVLLLTFHKCEEFLSRKCLSYTTAGRWGSVFEEHDLLTDVCSPAHADAIGMRHVRWENPSVPSSRTKFSLPHDCFTPHVFPTSVGASGKGLVQSLFQCLGLTSRTEMKYIKTQEETAETHGSVTSFIPTRLVGGFLFLFLNLCVCLSASRHVSKCAFWGQLWRAGPLWDPESECRPSDLCSKYLCLLKLTCFRLDILQT